MPTGVQGSAPGTLSTSRPRLTGCSPSASLAGSIASRTAYSSTWSGSGNCTMYPVHEGSALSSSTTASTSACVADAGSSRWMLAMPTSAQSLCLALTYQRLPGSSPTSSVPRPGRRPTAARAATRSVSSPRIAAAVALPSRIVAGTSDSLPETVRGRLRGPTLPVAGVPPRPPTAGGTHMTERDPVPPGTPPRPPAGASAYPSSGTGYTAPEYSDRPVAFRGPESLGGLLLILAGVAAGISLLL